MKNSSRIFIAAIILTFSSTSISAQYRNPYDDTPVLPDSGIVKPNSFFAIVGAGLGSVASEFSLSFTFSVLYNSNEIQLQLIHTIPDDGATSHSSGDILFAKNYTSTSFPTQQLDEITLLYGRMVHTKSTSVTFSAGLSWASGTFRGEHINDVVTPITNWWTDAYGKKVASMDGGTDTKKYYRSIDITSTGYTAQMKWRFDLGKSINLGVTGFVTYHPESTYFGALFSIDFGSFHS